MENTMTTRICLALLGSVAIGIGSTAAASAACIDDVRALHGEAMTGATATADPNAVPDTSPNPNEVESSEAESSAGGTTATEEMASEDNLDATGNAEFDTAVTEAMVASAAGDEAACLAALERARNAM